MDVSLASNPVFWNYISLTLKCVNDQSENETKKECVSSTVVMVLKERQTNVPGMMCGTCAALYTSVT